MLSPFRKKIWDKFYALIITDVLIYKQIESPTLQNLFSTLKGTSVYISLIEDLKIFFQSAELEYLLEFISIVIEESYSKERANEFINSSLVS